MTLCGCFLLNVVLGCFYLWGNISVYVLSYMYQFDDNISYDFAFYVDTSMKITMQTGYFLGLSMYQKWKINPKYIITTGSLLIVMGVFLSSLT